MSAVRELLAYHGDDVLYENESYLHQPVWVRLNTVTLKLVRTALSSPDDGLFRDCEVVREFAVSKDGTRVPLTIVRRKGIRLDGKNPTLLHGYGGYGENEEPQFDITRRLWLEQGGVSAVAHPRGDGEFGAEWHRAGKLTRRQTVFDDFAACARHLIERKYTTKDRLALEGASNGGLLIGTAVTQHPELFRAAVAFVGVFDLLRTELHPNGFYSITELGTVKDRTQFQAMYAYSPLHRVKIGTAYPAMLFLTGANDNRVAPYESWKMAARMQAASVSGRPILLRTNANSGHEPSNSEGLVELLDAFTFLVHTLELEYRPQKEPAAPAEKVRVRIGINQAVRQTRQLASSNSR
jgi:prolyl oligopeptidase